MYSASFRRLQGKMQLLGIKSDQFFRNRLTHSLEVAQIARSIATVLKYSQEESYVVEAGALAHDIGNPPFGHAGEGFLHKIFLKIGGFEGNAQSLRILADIERKRVDFQGLNLTIRTLLSIVKYYKKFDRQAYDSGVTSQKFVYDDNYSLLESIFKSHSIKYRTLDVQIVDIADEIAYAAHDLEDGLRTKIFTIEEVLHEFYTEYGDCNEYNKLCSLVSSARKMSGFCNSHLNSVEVMKLFYQEISSQLINLLLDDIDLVKISESQRVKTSTMHDFELGFVKYGSIANGLKRIVFRCINHNDQVYQYEQNGRNVLEYLANHFRDRPQYLPPEYRCENQIEQDRRICDYIAGMMDSFAITTYEKYSGNQFPEIF